MSKSFTSVIVVAAVAAAFGPAHAGLTSNGLTGNGLTGNGLTGNGLTSNGLQENGGGVMMGNDLIAPDGISTPTSTLQAVRLVMPDGTELFLR